MIRVYVFLFEEISEDLLCNIEILKKILPEKDMSRLYKYKRPEDRFTLLIGKLLLKYSLRELGLDYDKQGIRYTKFGKPYLEPPPFFNISHTNGAVICAISEDNDLGVDIERRQNLDFEGFSFIMTEGEKEVLESDKGWKKKTFFEIWTKKEAAIKAEGKGMNIPLHEVNTIGDSIVISGNNFYLHQVEINENFSCHLATSLKNATFQIINVTLEDIL